jgi:geranylgeranyl reductase family protein
VERREVIIVGAGPAGSATAVRLARRAPGLADGTLLLDKARHPRDKTCAGGVIPKASALLAALGVPFDVPQARVDRAGVALPGTSLAVPGDDLCRVVRRREFDARLAQAARARGVTLREDAHVRAVARDGRGVRVETESESFWAPVVVGADGSGSLVRRQLVTADAGSVGRAVMCDVPVTGTAWDGHDARRYDFDFRPVMRGVRGYGWAFPCWIDGVAHVNLGVYALPPASGAAVQRELAHVLADVGARPVRWQAFPIRTFVPGAPVAGPRALLVGDAAGCDPLMGEGISYALEYGIMAADAIVDGPDAAVSYTRAVAASATARKLRRLEWAARRFYGRHATWWFRLARLSRRAQAIGLAWYNGVDHWDERSGWAALRALVRPGAWQGA